MFDANQFARDLIAWFKVKQRPMPWRQVSTPYRVWISEMMLQQTQVATVIPYYERFMAQFPTLEQLALANEAQVLKAWQGLGYYSRARNLHATARTIVEKYGGQFPSNYEDIRALKGIGDYSAGAISSIAFHRPIPAVDGNVMRVMSRVLGLKLNIAEESTKKKFRVMMEPWIDREDPSSYNQGLMELGALICSPTQPQCLLCPVQSHCQAFKMGLTSEIPVKIMKTKIKVENLVAGIILNSHGQVLLQQRPAKGLLASFWQFPQVVGNRPEQVADDLLLTLDWFNESIFQVDHQFSHITWKINIFKGTLQKDQKIPANCRFVNVSELSQFPMAVAHTKILQWWLTTDFS